ncbi:sensor histidine kinase [Paenibacillus fonticola]|uniref:sensor histidine kinase n=1 Tax=Paenibacillus fonticola TaxID=379896 RepID=UPI00036D54D7|nr:ATP-binding protein [Paenibacillus fonticola]
MTYKRSERERHGRLEEQYGRPEELHSGQRELHGKHWVLFAMLLLVTIGFLVAVLLVTQWNKQVLWLMTGFTAMMLAAGWGWLRLLRYRTQMTMNCLDEIIEGAIHGRERVMGFTESGLSALEHKLIRYIGIAKSRELKLEAERGKIKQLISDISHQTKTPLANIMLYSQLLMEQPGLNDDAREKAEQISAGADKLDWLIGSLIKLSRLETGMISIHQAANPVIHSLTAAIAQVYPAAEESGMTMTMDCRPEIEACHDPKWTSEALSNVLENAVKYSRPQGRIEVAVECYEMFVRIDVADNGIGVEEGELNYIFQRFYRSPRTAQFAGVGIGLYLAREIITAQGGYMKAFSRVGEGTVISMFLPRSQ